MNDTLSSSPIKDGSPRMTRRAIIVTISAATISALSGIVIYRRRQVQFTTHAEVELNGPFAFNRPVAISEPLFFVNHAQVCINSYGRSALVGVKFFFGGEPSPDNPVCVTVTGLSGTGAELFKEQQVCQDRRAAEPESLKVGSANIFVFAQPEFKVPRETIAQLARLRVVFDRT